MSEESKFMGALAKVAPGQVISILGKTKENATSFSVKLKSSNKRDNSHLNFLVEFNNHCIIRSVKHKKRRKNEERITNLFFKDQPNPIKPGEFFKIAFYIDEIKFYISINDKPFCTYAHQFSPNEIDTVKVAGDIQRIFQFDHFRSRFPAFPPPVTTSFSAQIPEQFRPGNVIVIEGTPKGNAAGLITIDFHEIRSNEALYQLKSTIDASSGVYEANSFPITLDKSLRLAIALFAETILVSINGQILPTHKSEMTPVTFFQSLLGFKIVSHNGLRLHISAVEHHESQAEYEKFEKLMKREEKSVQQGFSSRLRRVQVGQMFVISGRTNDNASSFTIDLTADHENENELGDIPLHICAFFNLKKGIYRSSHFKEGQRWDNDECDENMFQRDTSPLRPGSDFKFNIYVEPNMFIISVNDKPFCTYPFRQSLDSIKILAISGDIEAIYHADHISVAEPNRWPPMSSTVFRSTFSHPIGENNAFLIVATPLNVESGSFTFCMFHNGSTRQILKMQICFDTQMITTRTQMTNCEWRPEMRFKPSPFPFAINEEFKLAIGLAKEQIVVACNETTLAIIPSQDIESADRFEIFYANGWDMKIEGISCCEVDERTTSKLESKMLTGSQVMLRVSNKV